MGLREARVRVNGGSGRIRPPHAASMQGPTTGASGGQPSAQHTTCGSEHNARATAPDAATHAARRRRSTRPGGQGWATSEGARARREARRGARATRRRAGWRAPVTARPRPRRRRRRLAAAAAGPATVGTAPRHQAACRCCARPCPTRAELPVLALGRVSPPKTRLRPQASLLIATQDVKD